MSFQIMSLELILPTLPEYAMILEVDWSGNIVHSWHSNSADLRFFSDAKIIVSILEKLSLWRALTILSSFLERLHVSWIPL